MVRISVLHDALKTMYNAEKRGKRQVLIRPSSKVVIKFLQVMMKHGEQIDSLEPQLKSFPGRLQLKRPIGSMHPENSDLQHSDCTCKLLFITVSLPQNPILGSTICILKSTCICRIHWRV